MKVTDYIIEFFIKKEITNIFGYPGGVICHLLDSAKKYENQIKFHLNYHEQASAFSACGYAQETNGLGVAYATCGPGATNLATGIANAYFDSLPVLFITGQVDTYNLKGTMNVRQRGFQETNVVEMFKCITKYAVRVDNPEDIPYELQKAYDIALSDNPGPVLVDIPADVQRANINPELCNPYIKDEKQSDNVKEIANFILKEIGTAKRPCFIVGNGVKQSGTKQFLKKIVHNLGIPTVFSMPAVDTLPYNDEYNFGFIGANGHRYANFILGKSDCIITFGTRLDSKQVGNNRTEFANQAKIIRIDIDNGNFQNTLHNELDFVADLKELLPIIAQYKEKKIFEEWLEICKKIKNELEGYDTEEHTDLIRNLIKKLPGDITFTADVGQNEIWVAQQIQVKEGGALHLSAGHGAMGYSLPAAIGAYYGKRNLVCSFCGDGGVQMNIQELQFLSREKIPVWVIILNNETLGMIKQFQDTNFNGNYVQTVEKFGYLAPDFQKIAYAFGLKYLYIRDKEDLKKIQELQYEPALIEVRISKDAVIKPNFGNKGVIQAQKPYIAQELFDKLMSL